jgi:plasmid stabilization system protein ParE
MKIIFTETFYEDLRNIWDFIASDNPTKATDVTEEIIQYCEKYLSVAPQM